MQIKNRGNNRIEKTRNLARKLRDTKGIFHANMGTIKDRSGMNLAEAENVMKCWQEYKRRTVPKKGLNHLLLLLLLYLSHFSHVWFFTTSWTAPYQAPPTMKFSRHEYWSRVSLPSPLNHLDNHNGVIIHRADNLGCEFKWILGGITTNNASWGDRIEAQLCQQRFI